MVAVSSAVAGIASTFIIEFTVFEPIVPIPLVIPLVAVLTTSCDAPCEVKVVAVDDMFLDMVCCIACVDAPAAFPIGNTICR